MNNYKTRTSIAVKPSTKERLNSKRAPGQCYDGFLCQMLDAWESVYNFQYINNPYK
ncbi:MAG: hypothetical protein RBS96_06955 [Dehalococcoidales bacterium]|jgi:hypothetical protein|nr:hypothetical protein [Dehalococcoidales bacterium]